MSSSSAQPFAPAGLGPPSPSERASAPLAAPAPRAASLEAQQLEFARRVRVPWWRAGAPLFMTALLGAGVAFIAAASPPTATVQRMLREDEARAAAGRIDALDTDALDTDAPAADAADADAVDSDALDTGADYELPVHWQWPDFGATPAGDEPLACDPVEPSGAC